MFAEETSIVRGENNARSTAAKSAAACVDHAFTQALALQSRLTEDVLTTPGMSGRVYRRFINNLMCSFPGARYLEIGSWKGSTACAAMHGNDAQVTCIDNWSQFGGPKTEFLTNTSRARASGTNFRFIEADFRAVNFAELGRHNIYLFDGPHEYQDQYDGIRIAADALDDTYIQIVDDWNWERVREGTFDSIRDAGGHIAHSIEIRTTQDESIPSVEYERSAWHNGYFIGVVERK